MPVCAALWGAAYPERVHFVQCQLCLNTAVCNLCRLALPGKILSIETARDYYVTASFIRAFLRALIIVFSEFLCASEERWKLRRSSLMRADIGV